MENFYQFGALISAITFSGAGIFIKKINTRNFFSIPFYEGLFSIMIMLIIIMIKTLDQQFLHLMVMYTMELM